MDIMEIAATPKLNRAYSGHVGTSPLNTKNTFSLDNSSVQKNNGSFESFLLEAVENVNQKQLDVSAVQEKLITDPDSVDVHDVATAMAKAQMSLNLAQTVIDRLLTGWSEIQTSR